MNTTICPPHYIFVNSTASCQLKCPLEIYTSSQYDALYYINLVTAILCIIVTIIVIIPSIFLHRLKKWPNQILLILYFTILIAMILPLIKIMIYGSNWRKLACKNDHTTNDMSAGFCVIDAIWRYFLDMSSCILWFCICFNIMLKGLGKEPTNRSILLIMYIIASYGIPSIGLIIMLSTNSIKGSPVVNGCYIDSNAANGWILDIVNNIPLAIILISGITCIIILIVHITIRLGLYDTLHFMKLQWRLTAYVVIAFIPISLSLWLRFHTRINQDKIKQSVTDWATCSPTTFFEWIQKVPIKEAYRFSRTQCDPKLKVPEYGIIFMTTWSSTFARLIFMIIFMCDKQILYWWKRLIVNHENIGSLSTTSGF